MNWAGLISQTLASGTLLALAGLGLLINERVGVVNLGAEGMMLMAAVTGYIVDYHTGSTSLAFLAGAAAGAAVAACHGWLVIWLNTNQYATGLAMWLFGSGLSAFLGIDYTSRPIRFGAAAGIPVLRDVPFFGPAFFTQHPLAYLTIALAGAMTWFLYRTRAGLVLRAIGESPESAHALGYPVRGVRFAAVVAGGALCGVAGAFLSCVYAHLWNQGMVSGNGWIALSLTVFATWRPARVLLGAYVFGGATVLGYQLQAEQSLHISPYFLAMLPYVSCIVVLVLISRSPVWIRLNMPASLGKPFFPAL
jgi:simple sugar transport system permease protein